MNSTESIFHLVNKELRPQAIVKQMDKETFEEFSERVQNTLIKLNIEPSDSIIKTMGKRIDEIIGNKCQSIKYQLCSSL